MRKRFNVLLDLIEKHSFTNMVEIGLGKGETAKEILNAIVPSYPFVYYGVDPYLCYSEYNEDINAAPNRLINNRNCLENNLSHIQNGRFVHFELFSYIACHKFMDKFIHLLFIDGNHSYEYVKKDLEQYWSKVKNYGIVAIHDYVQTGSYFSGVKKAVDEFVKSKELQLKQDADVVYFYKIL